MAKCTLCPRRCGADREVRPGVCGVRSEMRVAGIMLHHWEEPCLSGNVEDGRGSGAVFFTGCPLHCVFCQNGGISDGGDAGKAYTPRELADAMLDLESRGAYNINLVSPTQFTDGIIEAVAIARPRLTIPVVWNTGGYERVETLRMLDGHVQVYLPDFKYMDAGHAKRYSGAADYFEYAAPAIREMLRQTGPVELDEDALLRRGTIIRHLILPGCAEESCRILDYIAEHFSGAWVSLMAQYLPFGNCEDVDALGRRLTQEEYDLVADHLVDLGLEDGFIQELSSSDEKYIPKFDLTGI